MPLVSKFPNPEFINERVCRYTCPCRQRKFGH